MTPAPSALPADPGAMLMADELDQCAKLCEVYSPDQCATLIDGIGWIAMRHKLQRAAEMLRSSTPALAGGEVVAAGVLTVAQFRGHLENTSFDYIGSLPDGTYRLYTAPPAAIPVAALRALADKWREEASPCAERLLHPDACDALYDAANELTALIAAEGRA